MPGLVAELLVREGLEAQPHRLLAAARSRRRWTARTDAPAVARPPAPGWPARRPATRSGRARPAPRSRCRPAARAPRSGARRPARPPRAPARPGRARSRPGATCSCTGRPRRSPSSAARSRASAARCRSSAWAWACRPSTSSFLACTCAGEMNCSRLQRFEPRQRLLRQRQALPMQRRPRPRSGSARASSRPGGAAATAFRLRASTACWRAASSRLRRRSSRLRCTRRLHVAGQACCSRAPARTARRRRARTGLRAHARSSTRPCTGGTRRITPRSGTSTPPMRALRVYSPKKRKASTSGQHAQHADGEHASSDSGRTS